MFSISYSVPIWLVHHGGAEGALQLRALFGHLRRHLVLLFAEGDVQVDLLFALGDPFEQPLGVTMLALAVNRTYNVLTDGI